MIKDCSFTGAMWQMRMPVSLICSRRKCMQVFFLTVVLTWRGLLLGTVSRHSWGYWTWSFILLTMIIWSGADQISRYSIKELYMVTHSKECFLFLQTNLLSVELMFLHPANYTSSSKRTISKCLNILTAEMKSGCETFLSMKSIHISIFQDVLCYIRKA